MIRIDFQVQRYALLALTAAALFGASVPFAKLLLGEMSPVMLAGLLHLGSGLGLALLRFARRTDDHAREARLVAQDWGWLSGAIVAGGVIAPRQLLWSFPDRGVAGVYRRH